MSAPTARARLALGLSIVLFAALAAAVYLTSTATESPARTVAAWAWTARYELAPVAGQAELEDLHLAAADGSREQCIGCHGDKQDSELPVHRIHLRSELLPSLDCHECHPRVEIGSRGATTAVSWVDVGFCKECHSPFPGLESGSHMQAGDIDADCTMCHTGSRSIRHAQPYLSQIIDPADCKGCHGGRVLPWTPRHEDDDWLDVHGFDALDVGRESCFACHDFGLKFCDECHNEMPPSHMPEDVWLDDHPEAAAQDTRPCYTCHDTGHCKQCHVDHEAGWLESHPDFVERRGDETCVECHSLSSCSFCHTAVSVLGTGTPPA
jgi:hypothetical protein